MAHRNTKPQEDIFQDSPDSPKQDITAFNLPPAQHTTLTSAADNTGGSDPTAAGEDDEMTVDTPTVVRTVDHGDFLMGVDRALERFARDEGADRVRAGAGNRRQVTEPGMLMGGTAAAQGQPEHPARPSDLPERGTDATVMRLTISPQGPGLPALVTETAVSGQPDAIEGVVARIDFTSIERQTTPTRLVLHNHYDLNAIPTDSAPIGPEPEVHVLLLSFYRRSGHPITMRLLMRGAVRPSIKYIEIDPGVFPEGPFYSCPRGFVLTDKLPLTAWNHASMRPGQDGRVELFNVVDKPAEGILPMNIWEEKPKVEYTELQKMRRSVGTHAVGDDRMCVVTHPLFGTRLLVMKLAVSPGQIATLAKETKAYRDCDGLDITPEFLGYVADGDSVIGFLAAYISPGRTAERQDYDACQTALSALHNAHWNHGDPNGEHFVVDVTRGKVLIVGFSSATDTMDEDGHEVWGWYTVDHQRVFWY